MQTFKINSPYNNLINLKVIQGHFATTSSHINYYIDLTTLKARANEAKAVAKSMSQEYLATTIVDTIVCIDGTNVIGAYLADALTESGIMSMNQHNTMYITTPEVNSVGQLTFKDDVIPMIRNRHVLLLLATATTGHTTGQAIECIKYYGGSIAGISAIFSAIENVQGYDVHTIFHLKDIEGYASYNSHECPFCKAKVQLDGLVSAGGITGMNFTYDGIEHLS
ncbi:orotate phosphoribosyltransferase [Lachnospiraceae bacterium]|nr:orotate phosphoribosyltransferase [Lachnospiraceae bacterium]